MKPAYLAFAFLLELCMLAAFGYWGFQQTGPPALQYLSGIGLPLVAIILWGFFAAPRSKYRFPFTTRLIFETILFIIAAVLLYKTGRTLLATMFFVLIALRQIVSALWKI